MEREVRSSKKARPECDHGDRRGYNVLTTNSNKMNPKMIRAVFPKDIWGMGKMLDISVQALLILKQILNRSLLPAYTTFYIFILMHSVCSIGIGAS